MKNIDLTKQDYAVADGKVVITSDELLNMIQSDEVAIDGEEENYYLNARYLNGVPLEQVWNNTEDNPYLEVDSILANLEESVRGGSVAEETDIGEQD